MSAVSLPLSQLYIDAKGENVNQRFSRIIAKGSGHGIQIGRPELMNEEVWQVRGTLPLPTDYGSTTREQLRELADLKRDAQRSICGAGNSEWQSCRRNGARRS
jgi:hypothetical protein